MLRMRAGIVVEAELGQLGGVEEHVEVDEANAKLTDPDDGARICRALRLRFAGVAIGTSHGAFKFWAARPCAWTCSSEIQKALPGFPLVMHGSSSVPQEEVERINAAGGSLKGAKGVDDNQFLRAAQLGVTKINIDTDGRLVWTRVHREYFRDFPEKFDLRDPGKVFMAEYAKFIADKNEKLGSAGQLAGHLQDAGLRKLRFGIPITGFQVRLCAWNPVFYRSIAMPKSNRGLPLTAT